MRSRPTGTTAVAKLERNAREDVGALLERLSPPARRRLTDAMKTVWRELEGSKPARGTVVLCEPSSGDYGWVVARHGELYAREYGWGPRFEGLVAEIVADFVRVADRNDHRGWIAEVDGERVGSIFATRHDETTAALRLLLVEPSARGLGVGTALVGRCVQFARDVGYARMRLWTQSDLADTRRIYERAGFGLDSTEMHTLFGPETLGQVWSMDL